MTKLTMNRFIGTKILLAQPCTKLEYNRYRGWELPSDEDGSEWGYLVEYTDGGKPNHADHQGYISWSPKEQFENAYRQADGMSFGLAIEALKKGLCVSRSGWNGKGMYLALQFGSVVQPENAKPGSAVYHAAQQTGSLVCVLPHIDMKAADGSVVIGWLASQTDMLADDWQIIEPVAPDQPNQ